MKQSSLQGEESAQQRDALLLHVSAVLALLPFTLWMWLAMMLVHELGHVLAACATGGRVLYVNVHPGQLSSTLVQPNPAPSLVLWSGFLCGWLAPQGIAWSLSRPSRVGDLAWCWAGFCWFVGGIYLAAGGLERLTDTGQLVRAGWPLGLLVAIGVVAAAVGYAISRAAWGRLVRRLDNHPPSWPAVATAWALLVIWCVAQWGLAVGLIQILVTP